MPPTSKQKPLIYYVMPNGAAGHAAYALSGSQAQDAASRDVDRRQGRGSNYTQGVGGAQRTDDPADLAIKCCCFACSFGCAMCWESCGGNPGADAGVAAAVAALTAPNEAILLFGRPLHGTACCWCTSDAHPFWSEEQFQRAVSAGLPPAHAVELVDGLDARLAAVRGDLPELARAIAPSARDGAEVAAWAASLGVAVKMEEVGSRWVARVTVQSSAGRPQNAAPTQQVMAR